MEDVPPPRGAEQIVSGGPDKWMLPVRNADRFHRNTGHTTEWWKVVVKHKKDGNFHLTFSSHPTYQAKSGTQEYNGHSFPSFAYCFRGKIRVLRPIF